MSALQEVRKLLFASDNLKIIDKSWETLDLVLKADVILCGSLNAKLSRDTLKLYEVKQNLFLRLRIFFSRTIEGPELQSVVQIPVLHVELLRERIVAVM